MEHDDAPLVTVKDAARLLGVKSRNTLWQWRKRGHLPEPIDISPPGSGRPTLRYRRSDLLDFIGEKP